MAGQITVHDEAGEIVTDPQEQASYLWNSFRPNEVRIYDDSGKLLAVRSGPPLPPEPTFMQWLAAKFMHRRA